jgi:hypothetical protein
LQGDGAAAFFVRAGGFERRESVTVADSAEVAAAKAGGDGVGWCKGSADGAVLCEDGGLVRMVRPPAADGPESEGRAFFRVAPERDAMEAPLE